MTINPTCAIIKIKKGDNKMIEYKRIAVLRSRKEWKEWRRENEELLKQPNVDVYSDTVSYDGKTMKRIYTVHKWVGK